MNGVELKDHIRQMPPYTRTPIIVATSMKEMVAGRDYAALGFDGSFSKPVKLGDLTAVFDRLRPGCPADRSTTRIASRPSGADRQDERPRERRGRILVADDYLTNQQVAFMHLTAAGFSVDLAENGRQAVEAVNRNRYDLILMDIQMPVLNGFDATAEIRTLEARQGCGRRTPIIALTANAMKGDEKKCLDAGMDGYLIKPVHRHQLIKTANNWIGLKGGSDGICPLPDQKNPPESDDAAVMDVVTAVEEFGDADTVKIVARQLIDHVDGQLQIIRDAITVGDRDRIRREAHAIKGGAATMEAAALSNAAARLENLSPDGPMEELGTGLGILENQYFRFREFVSQWKGA
jgi:two-component system sensor histidine kinase/response regulator